MVILVFASFLHIGWCYLFTQVLEMKVDGLAYAYVITSFTVLFLITISQCFIYEIKEALFFPTKETWNNWYEYFALLIPSIVVTFAKELRFEVLVLLAGLFDNV